MSKEFRAEMAKLRAAQAAFLSEVQRDFAAAFRFTVKTNYGRTWVLTKNVGEGAPLRITFFDGNEPTGHIEVRSLEEAAREMFAHREIVS